MTRRVGRALATLALLAGLGLSGCTDAGPSPSPTPTPTGSAPTGSAPAPAPAPASTASPEEIPEPTTTNTLPPPPAPTAPAPSTAGRLTADSLPVPAGWKSIARAGGDEEGFRGNGTWVHARDPRYAAAAAISVGCLQITRDDYTDPTDALEGNYQNADGDPGVGLLLDFADAEAAARWFELYRAQVEACTTEDDPLRTTIVPSETGLVDRRRYLEGGAWLEVAKQSGTAVTLIILSDPDERIPAEAADRLLAQIAP